MASNIIFVSPLAITKLMRQAVAIAVNCSEDEFLPWDLLEFGMSLLPYLDNVSRVENKESEISNYK
jgi:hypothetical protein